MPSLQKQRDALRARCTLVLPGFRQEGPAAEFRRMADWCESEGMDHDRYGVGPSVESFERKIATVLGKPAAVFMPSGVMAQLIAVRLWTERAQLARFGMHPTSHLARHEDEAYAALMHCHGVPLGDRLRPMLAKDLDASAQALACVLVELPIREAGGQLPGWDELEALKALARERGVRLHMDGARLWECAAFYAKSYAEIAAGFDSVYVSLYKGIGASSGAMLAGDERFIAEARIWRHRMGGTLYRMSPVVASAAMRFDERIALMPALYERTVAFAAGLRALPLLRVNPSVPQTNMLHLHFDAPVGAVDDARDAIAEETGCWLLGGVRASDVPGWSVSEFYVGDALLHADDATVLPLFARLCETLRAPSHGRNESRRSRPRDRAVVTPPARPRPPPGSAR